MRPLSHTVAQHSPPARETYTIGGLLAFAAIPPAVFVLLAVPQLVLAYGLGRLSAVALLKCYHLVRTALDERNQPDQSPSSDQHSSVRS